MFRPVQFLLLESGHFSKRVAAYLKGKGALVTPLAKLESAKDLSPELWNKAIMVVDVDMAGEEGIAFLDNCAAHVILTGRPSRASVVLEIAAQAGWEALIKPYTPEELAFRATRFWTEFWRRDGMESIPGDASFHETIAQTFRRLFGCSCARLVELESGQEVAFSGVQKELDGTLVEVLGRNLDKMIELAEQGMPTVVRAADFLRGVDTFVDPYTAGDVLVIPFNNNDQPSLLLFLSRSSALPFDQRDIVRAEALLPLASTVLSPPEPETRGGGRLSEVTAKVVEYLPSGIIVVDPKGKVFSINRHGASILETDPDELVNRDVGRIFGLKRHDKLYAALKMSVPRSSVEQEVVLPTGKTLLLGLSSTATGDELESERGFVLIFQDISERRRLQERLRRTEQLASLGAMAAGMAHEIRNPLASMLTGVQILGSLPPGDPRAKRHRETIIQQITRLNGIIRDLLTLGRPARPKRKACAIARPVRQAAEMIAPRASEQNINVQLDIAETLPSVFIDEGQIQQVFINLFLNALEAMPEGGELKVHARGGKGDIVVIDITDSGNGISSEDIGHAFTPFFSTKAQGTGLGLTVCNRIVADHDGQLELRSTVGKGTTVTVELPVANSPGPHVSPTLVAK